MCEVAESGMPRGEGVEEVVFPERVVGSDDEIRSPGDQADREERVRGEVGEDLMEDCSGSAGVMRGDRRGTFVREVGERGGREMVERKVCGGHGMRWRCSVSTPLFRGRFRFSR